MKKFAISLLACLAMTPFTYAATSALTESILEYEAILTALGTNPSFENVIPSTQFIVDIERVTRELDVLGNVDYDIVTRDVGTSNHPDDCDCGCHDRHHKKHKNHRDLHAGVKGFHYAVVLNVAANPGIGPNIITVVSITPSNF